MITAPISRSAQHRLNLGGHCLRPASLNLCHTWRGRKRHWSGHRARHCDDGLARRCWRRVSQDFERRQGCRAQPTASGRRRITAAGRKSRTMERSLERDHGRSHRASNGGSNRQSQQRNSNKHCLISRPVGNGSPSKRARSSGGAGAAAAPVVGAVATRVAAVRTRGLLAAFVRPASFAFDVARLGFRGCGTVCAATRSMGLSFVRPPGAAALSVRFGVSVRAPALASCGDPSSPAEPAVRESGRPPETLSRCAPA